MHLNSSSFRLVFACVVVVALLAVLHGTHGADKKPAAGDVPHHVRVIWHSDPATTAIVAWTTNDQGQTHSLRYRKAGEEDWRTQDATRNEQFDGKTSKGSAPYLHAVELADLVPATKYELICESDDKASPKFYFYTAPNDDRPTAILFGGDSRSGLDKRQSVNRMMARMVAEQALAGRPEILALAHGGDYIRKGTNLSQWLNWLTHHEQTTGSDGRLLPVIPARGNHDMGSLFNQVFVFPTDDENYYAIDLAKNVRLATLNTETVTGGDQRNWLAEELQAHRWDSTWYLAQYHKPAFPAVKVPSGALVNWVPLFEEYKVNLVCEADGHVIKRTAPLRGVKIDERDGVVYIGEGGLGVGQRTPITSRWYLQETAEFCGAEHHVHLLAFHPDRLEVRVILLGGEVFDEFTLKPHRP